MNVAYKKQLHLLLFISFLGSFIAVSCRQARLEAKLNPENAEFLSKVRYIITPSERKYFLEMAESEHQQFKKDFWKQRDPDPYTELNEFKETYFARVEEADKLFSVGKPGWMTDRGEIYILFGPPTNIDKYPMGQGPSTHPTEIWYYGYFPIFFIDQYSTGDYIRYQDDVIHLHEINRAIEVARKSLRYEVMFFDFEMKFEREGAKQLILVKIPYKNLWLQSTPEGGETTLRLYLEVQGINGQVIWAFEQVIPLHLTDAELLEKMNKVFIVRVPVELEAGKYTLYGVLINTTDQKESKKVLEIKI